IENTFIGQGAGAATEHADRNTFVGYKAGWDNNRTNSTSNADYNTYLGYAAGYTNREGEWNVGIGASADFTNNTYARCTFVGASSTAANNDIIAVGYNAYASGQYSIGVGNEVRVQNTGSIGFGYNAYVIGNYSIGFGYQCSTATTHSIAVGRQVDIDNTDAIGIGQIVTVQGDYSIAIGSLDTVTGANSILIGYNHNISTDNTVYLGNASTTTIGGAVNWTAISDGRFKQNIQHDIPGLDFIMALRPVTYQFDVERMQQFTGMGDLSDSLQAYTQAKEAIRYSGFIAQEVEAAAAHIHYDFSGVQSPKDPQNQLYGLRYAAFVVPLTQAVKELHGKMEGQKQTNTRCEAKFADLEKRIQALEIQH
ncbi:MAG: tail fiber domain-containing protein, partial [Bacteroidota bacterium]